MIGYEEKKTPLPFHVICSMIILWGGAIIAYFFPEIISIIGILGGMSCISMIITFPGMIYVKLCGLKNNNPKKILVFIMTLLITLLGYCASILSLLEIIGVIDLRTWN